MFSDGRRVQLLPALPLLLRVYCWRAPAAGVHALRFRAPLHPGGRVCHAAPVPPRSGRGTQCCQVPAVLRIRIRIHFGQVDPDPHWEYGSGSRRAQITHKSEETLKFWSARCSRLRDEDSCWSLDVLYGGLGISKMQFLKKNLVFSYVNVFQFLVIKTLNLDPDPHWNQCGSATLAGIIG